MMFAGVDIGSNTTKACVIDERGEILSYSIIKTGAKVKEVGKLALEEALKKVDGDVEYIVATGYGRNLAAEEFANEKVTEITCHATGVKKIFPDCRTVIDIGGQDSKAIALDENGRVINFAMNDKCAAGTGKFLEVMASTLGLTLEELSEAYFKAKNRVEITSVCTVFAESEVISLLAEGKDVYDVVAGVCKAIAKRVAGIVKQVGIRERVVMTGGVAKNRGVVKALEEELKVSISIPDNPQIIGAYGAALLALQRSLQSKGNN